MLENDEDLANFQNSLVKALYRYKDAESVLAFMLGAHSNSIYYDWLKKLDPIMLDIAGELTRKWAKICD